MMTPDNETPPVYSPNEPPRANSSIGASQPAFLNNFTTLYTAFAANHVPLDASSGAGDHTILQMFSQTAQFQTNTGELSLYGRQITSTVGNSSVVTNYQLFLRQQGNATEFPWTNFQIYQPSAPITGQIQYFSTLPGGLIIYFGTIFPANTETANTITLRPPICVNVIAVNLCAHGTNTYSPVTNVLNPTSNGIYEYIQLQFTGLGFPKAQSYDYIVIGNTYV